MILELTDLGAIKKMELDLSKNFILFCGPNSTGKTYASYILNAFLSNHFINGNTITHSDVLKEIKEKRAFNLSIRYIEDWLQKACCYVKEHLGTILGISEETKKNLFGSFDVNIKFTEKDYQTILNHELSITFSYAGGSFNITKENGNNIVKFDIVSDDHFNLFESESKLVEAFVNLTIYNTIFGGLALSRMLTVERNSIYTFKTELSISRNQLIDRLQQNNLESGKDIINIVNSSSRRYPLAVRNSLSIANDLENIQKQESDYAYIADEIENELLHGKVSMTKGGDVEFSAQSMSESKKIPFHLSSSIVKTMASLVIYLRHIAKKGDTIIVDEPEMNFHPDVQVLLSQIFAKLSNNGLHVVISTHSDYIIREVNNMIMAGALYNKGKAEKADECGYSKDCSLDKNSVEVIYFNPDHETGYVETQSLPIDDEGFAVSSIDKTIVEQNQRTESLYDSLYE